MPNTLSAPRRMIGTERLLQAQAAVAEKCRASRRFEPYRLKDQGNRRRCANVVGRDLGRQRDPPATVPHGMALHSLNEEVALARVVVGRRDGQRVEMSALDVLLDSVAVEMRVKKVPQRGRIQQRPGVASAKNCSKGEVHDPGNRIARLGKNIAAENIGGSAVQPRASPVLWWRGKTRRSQPPARIHSPLQRKSLR